jgi:hypothetical protein
MKPWRDMTKAEKAEECRRIMAGYPDNENKREAIERQIKAYETKQSVNYDSNQPR